MSSAPPSPAYLEELIDLYTDNLMRAAFSLGFEATAAEELVQDSFCAYLDGGHRFEKRSQILTYLFGILYNKARESKRYAGRHESLDAAIDGAFASHFDYEEHWNAESEASMSEVEARSQSLQLGEWLTQCLEGLSIMMRMAFTLKEVEGMESEEICMALGLTPSNLGVTLFRARNKLRECLTAKGTVIV